jgi:hypothetical protein
MGLYKRIYTWREAGSKECDGKYRRLYNQEKQRNFWDSASFSDAGNTNLNNCPSESNRKERSEKTKLKRSRKGSTALEQHRSKELNQNY